MVDGVDEVRKAVREEMRAGAHQIKTMASGGVAPPTDPIGNLQFSVDGRHRATRASEVRHSLRLMRVEPFKKRLAEYAYE